MTPAILSGLRTDDTPRHNDSRTYSTSGAESAACCCYTAVMLPFYDKLTEMLDSARDTTGFRLFVWPPFIFGVVLLFVSFAFYPDQVRLSLQLALFLAPIWLPFLILHAAWDLWLVHIRSEFIESRKYQLLEIKMPRNLVKTPLAMETVFANIHHKKGESNWYQLYWQGQVRPYWSFEIASFGGQIHFYVWTRTDSRKIIENAFYAQYPGVQLVEAVDYTRTLNADPSVVAIWGCDFKKGADDVLPIKTYVEFGLDRVQKEPEQVDPFAHIVEYMGSIGKGEFLWLQLIIRTHQGEKYRRSKGKSYDWRKLGKEKVEEIRKESVLEGFPLPTKGQSETMAAIERNTAKLAYDVGGRAVYIAEPSKFNGTMITGMVNLFKPFASAGWNSIVPTHFGTEFNDYPWEIGNERRKDIFRREIIQAFRRRQYYHEPFMMSNPMILSVEEIASIYHVPSSSIETPGLRRIQSATGEAPANLPV
jgi:hypothetical protein